MDAPHALVHLMRVMVVTVLAGVAMPLGVFAQDRVPREKTAKHHHYKLIDMGTLGGPGSFSPFPWALDIDSRGLATAEADTSMVDPYAPNCLQSDCLVNHPITWQHGVQTDLGALPGVGNSSIPNWVNDVGDVVGMSNNGVIDPLTGYPEFRAVLWRDGNAIDLGTLGGNVSFANAINDHGVVVGGALNTIPDNDSTAFNWNPFPVATQFRAFMWKDGLMRDLGTLGSGNDAVALFVNDRGQVSGVSFTNATPSPTTGVPTQDPFFWDGGQMVDIGTLGGTSGAANWMNSRGQVVGSSNLAGDQLLHAFLWDEKQGLKDLGTLPGGNYSEAFSVNDAGEVVGWSDSPHGFDAVLWKNGRMIDLGKLPGDCYSEPQSINSRGQIVGNSGPCGEDGNGVLWENGGAPVNLNTLITPASNVTVIFTVAINDRGEIGAHGQLPDGNQHAVLLIPCDENHASVAGCDFAPVESAADAPTIASSATRSGAEVTPRHRAPSTGHLGRF